MTKTQYILYSIAAALMAAGESLKNSADNAAGAHDEDGVIDTSAGVTNATGEAINTAAPQFDSAGLPWDERIHSGSKSIKADGTWTKRKNTPPTVVQQVEAELRAKMTGATTQPTLGVQLPGATLAAPVGLGKPGLPSLTPAPMSNYQQLCAYLAANTGPGKAADDAWVNSAFASRGVAGGLASLATDEAACAEWLKLFQEALS